MKTLQECYEQAGGFPFLVTYKGYENDPALIVGRLDGKCWVIDSGQYYVDESAFTLIDYFEQDEWKITIPYSKLITYPDPQPFSWNAPSSCTKCAPYWTTCRCGGSDEA